MATLVHLRLDEPSDVIPPSDAQGSLGDLDVVATGTVPPVVDAFGGVGRNFGAASSAAIAAVDITPGASLSTRDTTLDMLLFWDFDAQNAAGVPRAQVVTRGIGGSSAEYAAYRIELRIVNYALRVGEIRFVWQTTAGVEKIQAGGQFVVPADGYLMLTATRRWLSSTEVELQYYAGELLVGDHVSLDGDIGGGTTGTFQLGTVGGNHFYGVLDELRVRNEHVTQEQVQATWLRLSSFQPRAYKAMRDLFQPEAPVSNDPTSRWQKLLRIAGHALGFAAAQSENVRRNQLPDRAYGPTLEQWERILAEAPRAGDSVARRRRRCVTHFSQRAGVSPPGVRAAIGEVLAIDDSSLGIYAFDQTTFDTFTTLNELRWTYDPAAKWTIVSNALRVLGTDPGQTWVDWYVARQSIGGSGRGATMLAKLTPTTIAANSEVGIMFADRAHRHAFLFGYRREGGGTLRLVTELVLAGVNQGAVVRNSPGALDPVWLMLNADPSFSGLASNETRFNINHSFTSGTGPWTSVNGIVAGFRGFDWACFYARALGGSPSVDVAIDDCAVRAPYGDRSFRFYVLRDPAAPGAPDYFGANATLRRIKHAFTHASVVTTLQAKYDSADTTYDGPPMGGL